MSSGNPYTKILGRVYDWQQNLDSETYWYPVDSYIIGEKILKDMISTSGLMLA